MNIYPKELHTIAKKYKRIFEKQSINAAGCLINNHEFYWVNYYRFGKMVGHAVISPNKVNDLEEYKQAFFHLAKSSQLRANLATDGRFRANINMNSFRTMEKFLGAILEQVDLQDDSKIVSECHEAMQSILSLQDRLVEIYKVFYEKEVKLVDGTEKFDTIEYLEYVLDCTSEIDYIQYTQLNLQYEAIPKFKYIEEIISKNNHIKQHMDTEVKAYLKEFVNSSADLLKSIKKVTYTPEINRSISKERHMELSREILLESVQNVSNEALNDLRFPKLR